MNIHQCERAAQSLGGESQFTARFPIGEALCTWIDPHFGFVRVNYPGLDQGFMTTNQIDDLFPNLVCSEPKLVTAPVTSGE